MTKSTDSLVKSHRDLKVWQKSIDLVEFVYKETKNFPKEEMYGITSQIRRAAASIPSNIAEGSARRSTKDFIRFINIAYGSLSELETQFYVSNRLKYVNDNTIFSLIPHLSEVGRMLNGLRSGLERKLNTPHKLNSELQTLDSNHA